MSGTDQRVVYTRRSHDIDRGFGEYEKFFWNFEHINDDIFRIKNEKFAEYLYEHSEMLPGGYDNGRTVFTWKNDRSISNEWQIILNGNNFYLRNVQKNDYLFGPNADNFPDSTKRYVLAYVGGHPTYDSEWEFGGKH